MPHAGPPTRVWRVVRAIALGRVTKGEVRNELLHICAGLQAAKTIVAVVTVSTILASSIAAKFAAACAARSRRFPAPVQHELADRQS